MDSENENDSHGMLLALLIAIAILAGCGVTFAILLLMGGLAAL
jgi:hypothetical protein